MKARTEWHFGGGAAYCGACETTCPECPYQVNSPRTEEGWQALAVLDVCSSQVRSVQGAVLGMDFNAWMSASKALEADPAAMTHLFPAVEAGLTQALNKPSPDNPHG